MKAHFVKYLACPACQNDLEISSIQSRQNASVESGELKCCNCSKTYPIVRFIPRFVATDNYAKGFGFQWLKYRITQLDSYTGLDISRKRFFEQTRWDKNLSGQLILEAGCGAGRFTEQAAATKAMVCALDLSVAVEANYANNGHRENVLIVQGSIYEIPFKRKLFDKVFCFGVLQHTPDPFKAFISLLPFLKKGGQIAIDIYRNYWRAWLISKYYLRPFTRNMDSERLYRRVKNYVDFLWPMCSIIRKIPVIGPKLNIVVGIPDHSALGVKGDLLKQWACLDCFDMLSARYDYPQTFKAVRDWFESQEIPRFEVNGGKLGIVIGRATI